MSSTSPIAFVKTVVLGEFNMSLNKVLFLGACVAVGYGLKRLHDVLNGDDSVEKTALNGRVKIKIAPNEKVTN